jgi:UDP-N-acetyl-2-amino-2-deoxyglucuronate dehydrogenase
MTDYGAYRVGILGCGGIANAHMKAYQNAGFNVVAAADIKQEQLDKFKAAYRIKKTYLDYQRMLRKEKLDIVSICTWSPLHCEMTVNAAEAGVKGILCEKPMSINLAEADMMIDACKKAGAKLAIGHMRRYVEFVYKARELIDAYAIGEPIFIHGMTVGDLLSDGTHLIDLVRFFAKDEPVNWVMGQVEARRKRTRYGHYIEDASIGYIQFKGGLRALVETSGLLGSKTETPKSEVERIQAIEWFKKGTKYCSVYIDGTDGRIELGEREQPLLRVRGKDHTGWQAYDVGWGTDPFQKQIEALAECIENNKEHPLNGYQGRAALEVIMAIFESFRRREIILFPVNVKEYPLNAMIEKGEI